MSNKMLIIGCGRLGASIANEASLAGNSVVVMDSDKKAFDRLSDVFSGYKILADATDLTALEDANIKTCREVVITTGSDNVNLFLAHVCDKVYRIPHIYVRFDDPDKGLLIKEFNVEAIYPFQLSHDKFVALKSQEAKK